MHAVKDSEGGTMYNEMCMNVCALQISLVHPCSFRPTITYIDVLASIKLEELLGSLVTC